MVAVCVEVSIRSFRSEVADGLDLAVLVDSPPCSRLLLEEAETRIGDWCDGDGAGAGRSIESIALDSGDPKGTREGVSVSKGR